METALTQRAALEETTRDVTIAVAAIALVIALLISWTIANSLRGSLGRAVGVFQEIANGRYDNDIPAAGADEAGQVLAGLRIMQEKLRLQIETERAVAAENARIRQALDRVSTSVILADASQTIIYINDTGAEMFARTQNQIGAVHWPDSPRPGCWARVWMCWRQIPRSSTSCCSRCQGASHRMRSSATAPSASW